MNILLIEHEGDSLFKLLSRFGCNVCRVRRGILARNILQKGETFTAVVAVYFLHDGPSWVTLLTSLKTDSHRIHRVILAGDAETPTQTRQAADAFVPLPVSWDCLSKALALPSAKTMTAS